MTTPHPEPVRSPTTNLQPDGTVFPSPPDPPPPPGYTSPLGGVTEELLDDPGGAYPEASAAGTEPDSGDPR